MKKIITSGSWSGDGGTTFMGDSGTAFMSDSWGGLSAHSEGLGG